MSYLHNPPSIRGTFRRQEETCLAGDRHFCNFTIGSRRRRCLSLVTGLGVCIERPSPSCCQFSLNDILYVSLGSFAFVRRKRDKTHCASSLPSDKISIEDRSVCTLINRLGYSYLETLARLKLVNTTGSQYLLDYDAKETYMMLAP